MKHFLFLRRKQKQKSMETLSDFATVFGNGFFPIIVCAVLFYIGNKTLKELSKNIADNTKVLTELVNVFKQIQ